MADTYEQNNSVARTDSSSVMWRHIDSGLSIPQKHGFRHDAPPSAACLCVSVCVYVCVRLCVLVCERARACELVCTFVHGPAKPATNAHIHKHERTHT